MAGKKNGKNGHAYSPPKYRTLNYKGDRDESIDDVHSIAINEGLNWHQLHVMSGVSLSTLNNWWNPKAKKRTMRPSHICMNAVLSAMGWEFVAQRRRKINVDEEMEKGLRWLDRRKKEREQQKE